MPLRTPHGKARSYSLAPRLETCPADELPAGVPVVARPEAPGDRAEGGRFGPGNSLAARGGAAKAGIRRMATNLGLAELGDDHPARRYRDWAREWRDAVLADLAGSVGGGVVGPMAASFVDSAAMALCWARWLSDRALETGDPKVAEQAHRASEASSRLVRDAWEYVARTAKARAGAAPPVDPLAAYMPTPRDRDDR